MRNRMPDGGGRGPPFCTCYGGVRQMGTRSSSAFLKTVGVLGQRIEVPHTPVGSVCALDVDR